MVLVEAADAVVVAGAAVEDGVLAVLLGSEELHLVSASGLRTGRPVGPWSRRPGALEGSAHSFSQDLMHERDGSLSCFSKVEIVPLSFL